MVNHFKIWDFADIYNLHIHITKYGIELRFGSYIFSIEGYVPIIFYWNLNKMHISYRIRDKNYVSLDDLIEFARPYFISYKVKRIKRFSRYIAFRCTVTLTTGEEFVVDSFSTRKEYPTYKKHQIEGITRNRGLKHVLSNLLKSVKTSYKNYRFF